MLRGDSGQVSRPVVIAAIVAGVAAVGLLAFNLLGDRAPSEPPAPPPIAAPPAPTPEPTPAPVEAELFEIFEGRDPFRPLLFATDVDPEQPAAPAPGEPPPPPGAPPPPPPPPVREGVQVEVMSVAEDSSSATVRVGSNVHENAQPGQTLSAGVTVVSIEGRCVNFRRNSDTFRLCEGEMTTK